MQPFLEAMRQAGMATSTDKISGHRYDQVYGRALSAYANIGPFAMLEIGYGAGHGVAFWRTLFPEVFHYCLDKAYGDWEKDNTCVLRVDQSKPEDLERAMQAVRHPIALIVDDGSHRPDHQLLSFSILFQHLLQPGGVYVIEDVETSYWRRGFLYGYGYQYGLDNRHSAVEGFKRVADYVNRRFLEPADLNWLHGSLLDVGIDPAAAAQVETVSFGRNAIVLAKQMPSTSESDLETYPHTYYTARDMPAVSSEVMPVDQQG